MDLRRIMYHSYDKVNELTTEELIALLTETTLDMDEVPFALRELYTRDVQKAMKLGKNILEKSLDEWGYYQDDGFLVDKYLQASVVDFFARYDKKYLVDYIDRHLNKMISYVYASVLEFLTDESEQPFAQQLSDSFLKRVMDKYQSYEDEEKRIAEDQYKAFTEAYGQRL